MGKRALRSPVQTSNSDNNLLNSGEICILLLYRQMQITQRELTLQKIIKNQEARILELEKLMNLPNAGNAIDRDKERETEQLILDLKERLKQKDKEIGSVKQQLQVMRGELRHDRDDRKSLQTITKQRDNLQRQSSQLMNKNRELEAKLQSAASSYEKQIQKLLKTNQSLLKQTTFYKENMMSMELEIEKLQIFYRSSLHQLPKRKQTLTWVGNLIKFIDKYEQLLKEHPLEKQCQYLQKPLNELKEVMNECSEEIKGTLGERIQEIKKLKDEIVGLISQSNKKYEEALEENKVFWEEIKKEKVQRSNQTERRLDEENKKMKQEHQVKYNELVKEFKAIEQQKREIVLAIQELKGYYQNRQKNYKDEIALLKNTELKLIECSERRECIFEQQILRLSEEVAYLGRLYEDTIRSNLKQQKQHLESEMKCARQLLTPKSKSELKEIISLLKGKQVHLQKQMSLLSEQQLKGLQLVKNSCDTLILLQSKILESLAILKSEDNQGEDDGEEVNVEVMKFQELEERKNYEISIAKKKNDRLQDLVTRLQQKVKNQNNPKDNEMIRQLRQRIQQLEDEKALLEQSNERYKRKFNSTLKKLSKISSSGLKQLFLQNIQMVQAEIQRIQSTQYQKLLPLIKEQTIKQEEYAETIESTLKRILKIMEEPFEYLNNLSQKHSEDFRTNEYSSNPRVIEVSVNFSNQIKEYKQILEDRVSPVPNNKINKTLSDLITNIRATLPQRQANRSTLKESENVQVERKSMKARTPMEQRIRDLQNSRIIDKNQLCKGLEKVQHLLKRIDIGKHTLNKSVQILGKIESSLGRVTKQIGQMLQKPLIERQFRELTGISKSALTDLESKLKQSICQNEGLVKQFKLLSSLQAFKQTKSERKE